jgi:hypothetical protein
MSHFKTKHTKIPARYHQGGATLSSFRPGHGATVHRHGRRTLRALEAAEEDNQESRSFMSFEPE